MNLLLRVRKQRDIRVTHRPTDRNPIAAHLFPPVKTDLSLRMQFHESDPAAKFSFRCALTPRKTHPPVTATTCKFMTAGINFVCLPDRGTLLIIKPRRLTLQRTR